MRCTVNESMYVCVHVWLWTIFYVLLKNKTNNRRCFLSNTYNLCDKMNKKDPSLQRNLKQMKYNKNTNQIEKMHGQFIYLLSHICIERQSSHNFKRKKNLLEWIWADRKFYCYSWGRCGVHIEVNRTWF